MAENPKDIWQKFKQESKGNNERFKQGMKENGQKTKQEKVKLAADHKQRIANIEKPKADFGKLKQDMNEIRQKAKQEKIEIDAEYKERIAKIEKPKADYSNMTGTKFLGILWLTILSFPLFIFGLILFVFGAGLIWSIFF